MVLKCLVAIEREMSVSKSVVQAVKSDVVKSELSEVAVAAHTGVRAKGSKKHTAPKQGGRVRPASQSGKHIKVADLNKVRDELREVQSELEGVLRQRDRSAQDLIDTKAALANTKAALANEQSTRNQDRADLEALTVQLEAMRARNHSLQIDLEWATQLRKSDATPPTCLRSRPRGRL